MCTPREGEGAEQESDESTTSSGGRSGGAGTTIEVKNLSIGVRLANIGNNE